MGARCQSTSASAITRTCLTPWEVITVLSTYRNGSFVSSRSYNDHRTHLSSAAIARLHVLSLIRLSGFAANNRACL